MSSFQHISKLFTFSKDWALRHWWRRQKEKKGPLEDLKGIFPQQLASIKKKSCGKGRSRRRKEWKARKRMSTNLNKLAGEVSAETANDFKEKERQRRKREADIEVKEREAQRRERLEELSCEKV